MNIDQKELREVAAATPARFDLYAGIHKAARAFMADTMLAVGRMDTSDALELAQVTERVLQLLDFCTHHLEKENEFVHPAIEARASGGSERIAHEHVEHGEHIAALARSVEVLRTCAEEARAAAAHQLYLQLAAFVAENFIHMNVEETTHNSLLWARYTDGELAELHHRIVSSIPPQEMMGVARWMVPFMNPAERHAMLADVHFNAPAPAFQALIDTVRPHLTAAEWEKSGKALDLSLRT